MWRRFNIEIWTICLKKESIGFDRQDLSKTHYIHLVYFSCTKASPSHYTRENTSIDVDHA